MKKMINYSFTGMGIGAFAYLVTLMSVQETSPKAIISILAMSGLIGLTAMIYERESLSMRQRWLLHLVGVLALVSAMLLVYGWFNLTALGWTGLIYTLIFWGIQMMKGVAHV